MRPFKYVDVVPSFVWVCGEWRIESRGRREAGEQDLVIKK